MVPQERLRRAGLRVPPYRDRYGTRFRCLYVAPVGRLNRGPIGEGMTETLVEVADPQIPGATEFTGNAIASMGMAQQYRQDLSRMFPKAEGEPLLLPFDINGVAAGNVITFQCESGVPEFWFVSLRPVANSRASFFNGPENSGVPFRLGGGGHLKVRAKNEFFTLVVEAGSAAIVGTVVALRKMEFDMNGGAI
jgi:hypothetical protein